MFNLATTYWRKRRKKTEKLKVSNNKDLHGFDFIVLIHDALDFPEAEAGKCS